MANERLAGLTIGMDMETAGIERSVTSIKRSFRGLESSVKTSTNNMRYGERTVENYKSNIETLSGSIEKQEKNVSDLGKQYESLSDEQKQSVKGVNLAREYNKQADELNRMNHMMDNYRSELKQIEGENTVWYKAGQQLQDYGSGLKDVGGKMQGIGSSMTNKITKPAGFAAGAVGGIVTAFGWERLSSLDTAQAQLRGLGYDTEEVGEISDTVTDAIDGGMTTMAEGTKIAAGAMAAGVEEGKDLERYIKLVGDAAVGANRPVEEMSMIFNRVQGEGKLMTRELNMIEQSMPGFSQAMADNIADGSLSAFKEMVTNGEVGSDEFLDVMEDFSGGMAEEYSKTWSGMVENTKAYIGQIGEAFLQGVFEDSKKSLADFIDLLKSDSVKQKATEMGETARDVFSNMKDAIVGVVEWYTNLDDWQKTLVKRLGLMAIAAGPVIETLGKMASGTGTLMDVVGGLSKSIGLEGGAGLVGAMGGLTKAGVVGLAIAGVGGLTYGIYELNKRTKEAKEVNLDNAESLIEQTNELDSSKDAFEKLSDKAKLSNSELAEMYDLNKRISESNNPGEIKELEERYKELAEKSGLSKDEIKNLFSANDDIIEQAPTVEQSISEHGNAFAKNTEEVEKYLQSLYEASEAELEGERTKLLNEEEEIRKDINQLQKNYNAEEAQLQEMLENKNLSEAELLEKKDRLVQAINQETEGTQRHTELNKELNGINELLKGDADEKILKQTELVQEARKDKEQAEGKLEKLDQQNEQYMNLRLKQVGINEEGEKGLEKLDSQLEKNRKDIEDLETKKQKNGELNEKDQERLDKLKGQVKEHENAKEKIFEETGLYNNLNSLIDDQLGKQDKGIQKDVKSFLKKNDIKDTEGDIYKQLVNQNSKYDDQIAKAKEEHNKGKLNNTEYRKQVDKLENKKSKNTNILDQLLKMIGFNKDERNEIIKGNDNLSTRNTRLDSNNTRTRKGIGLEEDRTFEAGKDVDKKININPSRDIDDFNADVGMSKDKKIRLMANPVGSKFNIPLLKGYAQGTGSKGHPGGLAQVNDGTGSNAGQEIIQTPSGQTGMLKGKNVVADLPRGSHVWSAKQSKTILGNLPQYAKGTGASVQAMFKGVTKKGLALITAAKVGSAAAGAVGMNGLSGITSSLLPIIGKNLTTNIDNTADYFGGSESSPSGSGVERWRGQVTKALAKNGLSTSKAMQDKVLRQIKTESGGNEKITQSSSVVDVNTLAGNPARGLMQTIPQTFHANKHKGHGDIYNGYDNLLAALRYAKGRYGKNLGHLGTGIGYKQGTNYVPQDGPAMLHKGEAVIPREFNQPAKRTGATKLLALVGKQLQKEDKSEQRQTHTDAAQLEALQQQTSVLQQQNNLLMQILQKDNNVYLDGDDITNNVNQKNALAAIGKHF